MQFAAGSLAGDSLGSIMVDPGAIVDPTSLRPILVEWNGVDARDFVAMDSLRIQDTLGQPVTVAFTFKAMQDVPVVGDRIRIFYHAQLLFAGTIDHRQKVVPAYRSAEEAGAAQSSVYAVDCLDWSQTLFRRKLHRNFTNLPIQSILDSILDNELVGEDITIGTIDTHSTIPLVDARHARVFDICRDMAGATGQTFYVDFDRSIQMRSSSILDAPLVFSEANTLFDGTENTTDRETYRNVQTVVVTGTPPEGQDALTTTQQRRNQDQIADRAAIEGGTGIYEEVEEITHPTSNDGADLALLGVGYARLRLATSGTPRQTVRCQVQGYGFRAGQMATVNLPTFGIVGPYMIQRVSLREVAGALLFHDVELTTSSLQQRAYESWLSIVRGSKVTVQMPGSLTNNLETFATPGADTWTVPAGVTVAEFTCYGGSAGGGGATSFTHLLTTPPGCIVIYVQPGGAGGNSGKAVTIRDVVEGQVFDLVIGAAGLKGTPGVTTSLAHPCLVADTPTVAGTDGTLSSVSLSGIVACQGEGGQGGHTGLAGGAPGSPGSGIGDAVSVGGGKIGGLGGTTTAFAFDGKDGLVEVRW